VFFSKSLSAAIAAGTKTVAFSSADLIFNGSTTSQENFGYRWAATGLGNGFFVLPATGDSNVYGFQISSVLTSAAGANGGNALPLTPSTAAFTMTNGAGESQGSPAGFFDSFGMEALGGVSFTGNTTPDLVVSSSLADSVYLFQTNATGVNSSPLVTLNRGGAAFGWALDSADVNGDGLADLRIGTNDSGTNSVFLYLNQGKSPFFSSSPSATITNGQSYFGGAVTNGDYSNAGTVDLAIGAFGAGTATIYY
jgi:hypothetical protein